MKNPNLGLELLEDRTLMAAGALDPTFGAGGVAKLGVPGPQIAGAFAVATQSDGKLVVVGDATPSGFVEAISQVPLNDSRAFSIACFLTSSAFGSSATTASPKPTPSPSRSAARSPAGAICLSAEA